MSLDTILVGKTSATYATLLCETESEERLLVCRKPKGSNSKDWAQLYYSMGGAFDVPSADGLSHRDPHAATGAQDDPIIGGTRDRLHIAR